MTVSNTTVKTSSAGNGSLSSFAIGSITFSDNADLDVYIRDETSSPATESLKTITTHYYITDSAGNQVNPGTHIKFDTSAGHTLPITDQHVVVKRKIELTQSTDYSSGDAFPADSHEDALDRLTLQVQQLQEQLDRNTAFPETYTVPGSVDTSMPEPEANGIMKWNATATALVLDTDLVNSTYKLYASNTSDTTAGFLNDKLQAGTGLSKSALTSATNQTVTLSVDLKDEDDMTSDSATHAASQQSIKAYVDAVTASLNAQDLDFAGDSGGAQNVDLDTQSLTVEGGTGIDTTGSAQKISIAIDSTVTTNSGSQSLTNKTIDVDNNTVSNIEVDNLKSGVLDTDLSSVAGTDTTLASAKAIKASLDTKQASITSSARLDADLIHDGSVSNTEFGHISTLSSNAQTQLDAKQATITGAATTITSSNLTASKALQSNASGKVEASTVSTTTLGYLDATSSVQTQLDAKHPTINSSARLDADLIHDGSVSNTEFGYINSLSSNAQTQLDAKAPISQPEFTSYVDFDSISAPSAPTDSGDVRLYANNSKLYFHGQGGSATEIGAGGGVGSIDTLFTIQAKSADNASDASGDDAVFRGAAASVTSAPTQDSTAGKLIHDEKVFKYASASGSTNDWWLYSKSIPQGYQNRNVVIQLQYYMEETSGDNLNEAFRFVARDATNGKVTQLNGAVSSSNTIVLDAFADGDFTVGDRVTFKDTSGNIHFRYITSVTHGSEQLTISGAAVSIADDAYFVSGILTDELDFLPVQKTTVSEAKSYKRQVLLPSNCDTLEFGFHYLGSETDQFLYYDDIALSANQFLQASSQLKSSKVMYHSSSGYGSDSNNKIFKFTNELSNNIPSSVATLDNNSASGFSLTANAKIKVSATLNFNFSSSGTYAGWSLNASSVTTNLPSLTQSEQVGMAQSMGTNGYNSATASIIMEKGDVLRPHSDGSSIGTADRQTMQIVVTPVENDVVLLNSQDEIFTNWTEYSISSLQNTSGSSNGAFGANDVNKAFWRRVGDEMEIRWNYDQTGSGTAGSGTYVIPLPSGYEIDENKICDLSVMSGGNGALVGTANFGTNSGGLSADSKDGQVLALCKYGLSIKHQGVSGGATQNNWALWASSSVGLGEATLVISVTAKVPIAGWSSTFNPVLSMPLQDFSSLENTFSARIASDGSITTQSGNCIASATKDSTGIYSVVFTNGFFGVAPSVVGIVEDNNRVFGITTGPTTSGFTYKLNVSGSLTDANVDLIISRQGSDFRQAPQATTAVIKPAVAIISNTQSSNTYQEGNFGGDNSWVVRVLNTIKGESWFINSLSSNIFTLQAGMYKVSASAPAYYVNSHRIQLYDNTNGATKIMGTVSYSASSYNGQDTAQLSGVFTITSATAFQIKHINEYNYANNNALGNNSAAPGNAGESVFTSVTIEKLK